MNNSEDLCVFFFLTACSFHSSVATEMMNNEGRMLMDGAFSLALISWLCCCGELIGILWRSFITLANASELQWWVRATDSSGSAATQMLNGHCHITLIRFICEIQWEFILWQHLGWCDCYKWQIFFGRFVHNVKWQLRSIRAYHIISDWGWRAAVFLFISEINDCCWRIFLGGSDPQCDTCRLHRNLQVVYA